MAKVKLSDKEQVNTYIEKLKPVLAEVANGIRKIILDTDSEISE